MVPVSIGYLPAVIILIGLWFTPESPRWLVSKGRKEAALKELNRLRPKWEIDSNTTAAEADALEEATVENRSIVTGRWIDLFHKRFIRRSMVCFNHFNPRTILPACDSDSYIPDCYVALHLWTNHRSTVCRSLRTNVCF
jgi:hypothetical protein